MASKSHKGIFYYLGLFLSFVFGVLCILVAILIFNPNKDVYGIGIRYSSCKDNMQVYTIPVNNTPTPLEQLNFNTVTLNANFSTFSIGYSSEPAMKLLISPNFIALTKNDDRTYKADVSYANNELKIDITEPNLFLSLSRNSRVELIIPQDYAGSFSNMTFNINSNSGKVILGDTTTGNYVINNLNVNTTSGLVDLKENVKVLGNVNIESKKGKVNINTSSIGALNIKNETGRIKTGNLNCNVTIDNRKTLEANIGTIYGDAVVTSDAGYITISTVNNFTKKPQTDSEDKDLTNITVEKINGSADIETHSGYVKIGEIAGKANIDTTSGNITIEKANGSIDILTTSGDVSVNQNTTKTTTIQTGKGSITIKYLNGVGAYNDLVSDNGDINISTMGGTSYLLNYETGKGLYQAWEVEQLSALTGTISVFGGSSTLSLIIAKTQGKINLYSVV